MRKVLLLTACLLSLLGCSKEQISSRPCSFDVNLTSVKGNKVHFTITPSNPEAYYTYSLEWEGGDGYGLYGSVLMEYEMEKVMELYDLYKYYDGEQLDFADVFCYQGTTERTQMFLDRNTNYKLVVFQVNPWKREGIGYPREILFRTADYKLVDLHFDLQFQGDTLHIHPSDPDVHYLWDYETVEIIESEYASPFNYFYKLADMYEQYGFLETVYSQGDEEWVFPRDDAGMPEGQNWYLILAGYQDGDLNSDETLVKFTWSPGESHIVEVIYD